MTEWTRENNPIDKDLKSCLDKPESGSTMGMTECESQAYKAWDSELNSVYKQIMKSELSPQEKAQFKHDEKNWTKFRDSELKFVGSVYGHTMGTIHVPMEADDATELVKDRVLQLHKRFDTIGDGEPGDDQAAEKQDAAAEIKSEAKQIATIVKESTDVRAAAENPNLEKTLTGAEKSNQLEPLLKATNNILDNHKEKVGYSFSNIDSFGITLKKEDRADSTITSDDPKFAGPLSEKQLDAAAAKIATVVSKAGNFGDETVKHEINQTLGRALKNHQEDALLEKINGDNLGDADIAGTHQYIEKQAMGVNWRGNHMTKFTLVNDDVAIVPTSLEQTQK